MRIKRIDILPLAAPLDRPFHWSTGTASVRRTTLVRVHTARGAVGWGETHSTLMRPRFSVTRC